VFGNKDKRAAMNDAKEAATAAFRAQVERLEALPPTHLAVEVMRKGFGPSGYLPDFVRREPYAVAAVHVSNIVREFEPDGARDADLTERLYDLIGEGLQILEHRSLIWARTVAEGYGVGYALTRRGRAALEADVVEQALRGESAGTA